MSPPRLKISDWWAVAQPEPKPHFSKSVWWLHHWLSGRGVYGFSWLRCTADGQWRCFFGVHLTSLKWKKMILWLQQRSWVFHSQIKVLYILFLGSCRKVIKLLKQLMKTVWKSYAMKFVFWKLPLFLETVLSFQRCFILGGPFRTETCFISWVWFHLICLLRPMVFLM